PDLFQKSVLMSFKTEFNGFSTQNRNESLFLKRTERRIRPGQQRAVAHIGKAHAASRMKLPGCALRLRTPIRKGEFLAMATRTRLLTVNRHSLFIKEVAP